MKAIALYGKMLSFSRLKIHTEDLAAIQSELTSSLKDNTSVPVVLDSECDLNLAALVDMLWELGVQPIGVVDGVLTKQANALRLATFPAEGKRMERIKPQDVRQAPKDNIAADDAINTENDQDQTLDVKQVAVSQTQTAPIQLTEQVAPNDEKGVTSSVHSQMLRSGQSLQHLGGDLIVIGGINKGAEAITDNNLHVYGHGQGRLVAGATGDKHARIFCQKFNPTLVSVAGTYCLSDAIPQEMIDKAVQVSYDEDKGLIFTLMAM